MFNTDETKIKRHALSAQAADELVRYLYLLIDDIQFSRYGEALQAEEEGTSGKGDSVVPPDFDDPIGF